MKFKKGHPKNTHLNDIKKEELTLLITKIPNFEGFNNAEQTNSKYIKGKNNLKAIFDKYLFHVEKIESALLKKGEYDNNTEYSDQIFDQNHGNADVLIANNIITLLENKCNDDSKDRDYNYYSKLGKKYVTPKKVKNYVSKQFMQAFKQMTT